MRNVIAIAALSFFVAAGCAGTPTAPPVAIAAEPPPAPVVITSKMRSAIERGARQGLKDPDSARFGDMKASTGKEGLVNVCGWLNAKNSYGGYTGMGPFTGQLAGETFVLLGSGTFDSIGGRAVLEICRTRYGLPLD